MKIPLSWLKEYISLNLNPDQIAKKLTLAGLEVDAIENLSPGFEGVVIGKVLETTKHPDADKLCIAMVSDGEQTYQVVCGAPNCRAGLKTAFAKIGASISEGDGKSFKIKKTKIRGIESSGMLCSASELKIGKEEDGIIEFESHLQEGTDLVKMYADPVFEISLTPNLSHCSSVIGVARELSAAIQNPLHLPESIVVENEKSTIHSLVKVEVLDPEKCPRYACRLIKNVKIGPSPAWLQNRLNASGIRPINNLVDVTNFVMLEMGHPMHAFDFDKLAGAQIVVRAAKKDELFKTLDDKERLLNAEDLLICDQTKPVAIAGVMGGQNSEVSETTQNVLLEAAYFLPTAIRKTSKRVGLSTEASKRFERGTDPNSLLQVLNRASVLIQQIAGGEIVSGMIDVKEKSFQPKEIPCRLSRIEKVLGIRIGLNEVQEIFQRLGMGSKSQDQETILVTVPTFRVDIHAEIDLIEEVVRIYGIENIPKVSPKYHSPKLPSTPIYLFEEEIRARLISEGLQEFLTCDLIGPKSLEITQGSLMKEEAIVKVLNPTSIEQSILRTSLLPGLLQLVKYNYDHQNHDISGFEIGRIHFKEKEQFKEQLVAGIILSGKNRPHHWGKTSRELDFFDLKGIVENLLSEIGVGNVSFKTSALHTFHNGRQASIFVGSLEVGSLGEVHPSIQRALDLPQRVYFAEINLHELFPLRKQETKMQEIPIYPASERDWTVTLNDKISIAQVFDAVYKLQSNLLESISLLDVYRSEKLGEGVSNMTFHFVYRDKQKTIEQEAVDTEHTRLTNEILNFLSI
jgi:phenylalanyl-tRNA synthetase beta chain